MVMDESAVLKLIGGGIDKNIHQQIWVDLGAGRGTFTTALGGLLDEQSIVYAIDKNKRSLNEIVQLERGARIINKTKNFSDNDFQIPKAHGVLMANTLHYVNDQISFLKKIKDSLFDNGRLVIVEYDRTTSNPWVPFPIPFELLEKIALQIGFSTVVKLGEQASIYDDGKMYGALVRV
jgi:ubiquinone/menaquinone biosynthesis C-methylase UbiE